MKPNEKNTLSDQERVTGRNERDTQFSFFHSIIHNSVRPTFCGSAVLGERGTGRAPQPDFNRPPWPGVMRAIYQSYRLDLPALRAWTLKTIERSAIEGRKI